MFPRGASRALLAVTAGTAVAQFSDWQKGQISTEICTWEQPRGTMKQHWVYCMSLTFCFSRFDS